MLDQREAVKMLKIKMIDPLLVPACDPLTYMGLNARKPVFGVSDKGGLKPVSSAMEIS